MTSAIPTVVVGDSIIVYAGYHIKVAFAGEFAADFRAEPGKRLDEMLPVLEAAVAQLPPIAVVNLGTNDALQAPTRPDWRSGFDRMIELLTPVGCVELTTINTDLPGAPTRSGTASEINRAIAEVVSSHPNFHVIDWDASVRTSTGSSLLRLDRVHPSPAGTRVIARLTRLALDRDYG